MTKSSDGCARPVISTPSHIVRESEIYDRSALRCGLVRLYPEAHVNNGQLGMTKGGGGHGIAVEEKGLAPLAPQC